DAPACPIIFGVGRLPGRLHPERLPVGRRLVVRLPPGPLMPSTHRRGRSRAAAFGVLLAVFAATVLRAVPLPTNRFHPDEALYAYFARLIASGHDPMLAGVVVDKPPAAFYLTALSLLAMGPNELAVRLPEVAAGLVSVALLYALG